MRWNESERRAKEQRVPESFKPGDKVYAYYDVGPVARNSGWYKAVVVKLTPDGNYLVRWDEALKSSWPSKPPLSSVNEDEIRHRRP
jgi:hypothetical protein